MHMFMTRLNELFAVISAVLAVQAAIACLTTYHHIYSVPADVSISKVAVKQGSKDNDLGAIRFNLKTDLQELYDWNVKQLYIYLIAEYETENNEVNQIVIWDQIVLRGSNPVVKVKNKKSKYVIEDDGKGLLNNSNVTLRLAWNVIPNVGRLQDIPEVKTLTFAFPSEYKTRRM